MSQDPGEHDLALDVHLADHDLQGNGGSGLVQARHLASDADEPRDSRPQIASDARVVLLAMRRGHEHADVPPDHFLGFGSRRALGCRVKRVNDAVAIDRDDAVDGGLDDGPQAGLTIAKLFLRRSFR